MEKKVHTQSKTQPITRNGTCSRFCSRRSLFRGKNSCWYCVFAGFDLSGDEAPEKGVCRYPVRQTN